MEILKHLDEAENPKGSNRGTNIDKWEAEFGLRAEPWCAIIQSVNQEESGEISPVIKSAAARKFATGKTHSLNEVQFEKYVPKCGDYRVKTRRGGHHVDVFLSWDKDKKQGYVIGGNVSDKVSMRQVTLKSMIADGTTHITEVHGNYNYVLPDDIFSNWLSQYGTVRIKKAIKGRYKIIDSMTIAATWYDLHGRRTASGETFNRTLLTAAHKSLKLGTKIIARYKNKEVMIKINDRCPKRNILDMSKAAMDSLNFKSGKLKIYVLE